MFNSEFSEFATEDYDFYPTDLAQEIDALNKLIYERCITAISNATCIESWITRTSGLFSATSTSTAVWRRRLTSITSSVTIT